MPGLLDPRERLNKEMGYAYSGPQPDPNALAFREKLMGLLGQFQTIPDLAGPIDQNTDQYMQQLQLTPEQLRRMLFIP